ncbi:MAG: CHAT domain-containing tetratricopeptide repeat protein [Planctomycetota bacterium]
MSKLLLRFAAWLTLIVVTSNVATADAVEELTERYQIGLQAFGDQDYAKAAHQFERAVQLAPAVYGPGKSGPIEANTARLQKYLADCYQELSRFSEAATLYDRAFATLTLEEGPKSQIANLCQDSLGLLHMKLGQLEDAERALRTAYSGLRDPVAKAKTSKNLGFLLANQDRFDEANTFFQKALLTFEAKEDRVSRLNVASCYHGLGKIAFRRGELVRSQSLVQEALQIRRQHLPASHRSVAQSEGALASVYSFQGRDERARPLLEHTTEAMSAFWKSDQHIDVAMEQHELALLLARQQDVTGAIREMTRSRKSYAKYIRHALGGMSQAQQIRFLDQERGRLMDALAMPLSRRGNRLIESASYEWALNAKGMAQETLAQRELLRREANADSDLADDAEKLQAVRQSLAAVAVAGHDASAIALRKQLAHEEAELAKRLARAGTIQQDRVAWYTASDIQRALPQDAALVEIVRLDRSQPAISAFASFDPKQNEGRYVAWVTTPKGHVEFVALGAAPRIDNLVSRVRQHLNGNEAIESLRKDAQKATQDVNAALRELAEVVLWPLLPHIQGAKRLLVSPDSQLWLVPWAALILPSGDYVVESLNVTHLIAGRDLLSKRTQLPSAEFGFILANPNFDLTPEHTLTSKRVNGARNTTSEFETRSTQSALAAIPRDWEPLHGTQREAEVVGKPMRRLVTGEIYLLQEDLALESHVKQSLPRPKVAVLATHGFFQASVPDHTGGNPLLRCGLILAGVNRRDPSKVGSSDDGVLTGMEVLQMDLRGTEIVALSACETGVGHVTDGEGVSGLRQAFHLAGAKRVVATLWNVSDHHTPELMRAFWESIDSATTPAESLRRAQLQLMQQLRSQSHPAHPWFWAAVTLSTVGVEG